MDKTYPATVTHAKNSTTNTIFYFHHIIARCNRKVYIIQTNEFQFKCLVE